MASLKLPIFDILDTEGREAEVPDLVAGALADDVAAAAYEAGYSAGWEDAARAGREGQTQIGQELANNLQRLGFTFQEARANVLRSVQPILMQLCNQLLPQVAQQALAPVILETLMPVLNDQTDRPIKILLNPAARAAVERLVCSVAGLPVMIEEEPTLGEGQVYLRLGGGEYSVDLDAAVAEMMRAVQDFFEFTEKEADNG